MYASAVQPALVQTDMNSFEVFSELKKTEAGRAAKPGDVAPHDIIVEKMNTGMPPGPIVGELNSVGIPAKIVKGSVEIQKKGSTKSISSINAKYFHNLPHQNICTIPKQG